MVWAVMLVACDGNQGETATAADSGERAYQRYCATCHGLDGAGKPPAFPPLAGSEWLALPDRALALIVLYGLQGEIEVAGRAYRGYMPAMSHMDDADVTAAVNHVVATWGGREATLERDDPARLRQAFGEGRAPWKGRQALTGALKQLEQP